MRSPGYIALCFRLAMLLFCVLRLASGATLTDVAPTPADYADNAASAAPVLAGNYKWNVDEKEAPLLGFAEDQLNPGLDRSLAYPIDRVGFLIFQSLTFDEERGRYSLASFATDATTNHFIEFAATEVKNTYVSTGDAGIRLIDNDTMKTIRTSDGARYIFVRYPDGEFRCATIKESSGATLNLLYRANGLMLHGIVDATGRSITFEYDSTGLSSVTQTWMAHSERFTKTWATVGPPRVIDAQIKYSHAVVFKALPANAVVRQYSSEMEASDKLLAHIFGGPNAVAGANGFEPAGLASTYPLYRGDIIGDDGIERRGHLSYAIHLYGSPDGTGESPLYVPAGFTARSSEPSPTDAAMTFYYPKLGNLSDVTLAIFHVADFEIRSAGDRVRIGNLGGPGGSSPLYRHSHIEFYRGNTGLPPLSARARLRINPTTVFSN